MITSQLDNASPDWVQSRNCDTRSRDFYQCQYWVDMSGFDQQFGRQTGSSRPTPHKFDNVSVSIDSVSVSGGSANAIGTVSAHCKFDAPAMVFASTVECRAGETFKGRVQAVLRSQGLVKGEWVWERATLEALGAASDTRVQARVQPEASVTSLPSPAPAQTGNLYDFQVTDLGEKEREIQLDGRKDWMSVDISGAQSLDISAGGQTCGLGVPCTGPNGQAGLAKFITKDPDDFPVKEASLQALVGSFSGQANSGFQIGENKRLSVPTGASKIWLRANTRTPELPHTTGGV